MLADLAFALDVPAEFVEPDVLREEIDFSDPTKSFPLLLVSSPVATALITVSARPAYDDGCVEQWLRFLADHFGMSLSSVRQGRVGDQESGHPAVLAEAEQVQDGTLLRFRLAALEDGGRFVIVMAMAPAELWPSYGVALEAAVGSLRLTRPKGSQTPLMLGFTPGPKLG
jgi:hypothetical protein